MTLNLSNRSISTWVEVYILIDAMGFTLDESDTTKKLLTRLDINNNQIHTWEGFTPGSLKALFIRENPVYAFGISLDQLKAVYPILQCIRRDKLLRKWVACYRAGVMCTLLETNMDSALFDDFRVGFLAG